MATRSIDHCDTECFPVNLPCPLCRQSCNDGHLILSDSTRFKTVKDYYQCSRCSLIFIPKSQHLEPGEEKSRYDQHENSPLDSNYRQFLSQLSEPVLNVITPNSKGLDFGSGPGPALHLLFEEQGHSMHLYDPIYQPDTSVLCQTYDFIVSSETFEHFSDPADEIWGCWARLREGGCMGVMTLRYSSDLDFSQWHYRMDDTHVCFYMDATFKWIAWQLGANITWISNRVVLLHKTSPVR